MGIENLLNLVWLFVSAMLLFMLAQTKSPRRGERIGLSRSKQLAILFLISIFVFPCISASDDLWSFQNTRAIPESRTIFQTRLLEGSESANWRLTHFFERLQSLTLSKLFVLFVLFCSVSVLTLPSSSAARRYLLLSSGRSPPRLFALV